MDRSRELAIAVIVLGAVALPGCPSVQREPEDLQALVDRLADTGAGFGPPEARAAYDRLVELETAAYDVLIANADDRRLACPCFTLEIVGDTTVGLVCRSIIEFQVEEHFYHKGGPHYGPLANLEQWWEANRGRTLPELQREALAWVIDEIEQNDAYRHLRKKRLEELKKKLEQLR